MSYSYYHALYDMRLNRKAKQLDNNQKTALRNTFIEHYGGDATPQGWDDRTLFGHCFELLSEHARAQDFDAMKPKRLVKTVKYLLRRHHSE